MPITDFDAVWQRPGDMPSQIDVFNNDAIANRVQDQAEYLAKLSDGLSAADRHKLGSGRPEELEVDLSKAFEEGGEAEEATAETAAETKAEETEEKADAEAEVKKADHAKKGRRSKGK